MKKIKIYVASSWRNQYQQNVVKILREHGYDVYDFKNPEPGNHGFHWSEIDPNWKNWTPEQFKAALDHPIAGRGYYTDMRALSGCDACVLVLPCGRSAHLEAGFAYGLGKLVVVLLPKEEKVEPELMYMMASYICTSIDEVVFALGEYSGFLRLRGGGAINDQAQRQTGQGARD